MTLSSCFYVIFSVFGCGIPLQCFGKNHHFERQKEEIERNEIQHVAQGVDFESNDQHQDVYHAQQHFARGERKKNQRGSFGILSGRFLKNEKG